MTADPLAALRARFLDRAAEDLGALRQPGADREVLTYVVHRLAGAAGMFGYHEVSRLAGVVDDQLHEGGVADPRAMAELVASLEALPKP